MLVWKINGSSVQDRMCARSCTYNLKMESDACAQKKRVVSAGQDIRKKLYQVQWSLTCGLDSYLT